MCGICGYIVVNGAATKSVIEALHDLEHRGYDSAGLSRVCEGKVETYKISIEEKPDFTASDLADTIPDFHKPCKMALGHNRWRTFGGINKINTHPHYDNDRLFYLVHNGNVENLKDVEKEIGIWKRYSETDTEAIVNLIAKYYKQGSSFSEAVKRTINFIDGANVIVVFKADEPEYFISANKGGPIILAKGKDFSLLVSDPAPLEKFNITSKAPLESGNIAVVDASGWKVESSRNDNESKKRKKKNSKNNYKHFMLKEIMEQAETFANAFRGRLIHEAGTAKLGGLESLSAVKNVSGMNFSREIRRINRFHFVACGTAYNAGLYAKLLLNRFGIQAEVHIANEFCYSHPVFDPRDAFILISQSGETADTIEVMNEIKIKGNVYLGILNVPDSRIWRETDAGIGIRAGTERGVASTKAFTSQLACIVLLAVFLARQRNMTIDTGQKILFELEKLPTKIEESLKSTRKISAIARKYLEYDNFYFLGRYFNLITAMEGSLKFKEISYKHSEAYPLGEMKHGPLALIDQNFPSFVIIPDDSVFNKSLVNVYEIKGREGKVIALTNKSKEKELKKQVDDLIIFPETLDFLSPILSVVPLQLLAYYTSIAKGINPDKPRNLAKTVTVS